MRGMKTLAERQREKRLREVLEALKDPVLFSPGVDPSALRDVFGGDALGEPRPELVGPITPFLVHPDERTRRSAVRAAMELSGLGPASELRPPASLERDKEPPAEADPRRPGFLFWVEWTVQQTESAIRCDGFNNLYACTGTGRAAAIHRAYAATGDPVRAPATALAAAFVDRYAEPCPGHDGLWLLPGEWIDELQKQDNAWRWQRHRIDLDAETRAALLLLRHADRLGGRRLDWVPDHLPGEDAHRPRLAPEDA